MRKRSFRGPAISADTLYRLRFVRNSVQVRRLSLARKQKYQTTTRRLAASVFEISAGVPEQHRASVGKEVVCVNVDTEYLTRYYSPH